MSKIPRKNSPSNWWPKEAGKIPTREGVSRQRLWQLRQRALGRCHICGEPCAPAFMCQKHTDAERARQRQGSVGYGPYRCSKCGGRGHGARSCGREPIEFSKNFHTSLASTASTRESPIPGRRLLARRARGVTLYTGTREPTEAEPSATCGYTGGELPRPAGVNCDVRAGRSLRK